jgi:hypothetical protein
MTKIPVVVVHDADRYEQNNYPGWKEILASTSHQWFKTFLPWTVILSPGTTKLRPARPTMNEILASPDDVSKASVARRVMLVCRSGGEYRPEHVDRLSRLLTDCTVSVLTDFAAHLFPGMNVIPLKHNWPGWWSKLELFRPDITGTFLYVDLDTTVFGRLPDEYFRHPSNLALAPFAPEEYRNQPGYKQSGMLLLHERTRAAIWARWNEKPDYWMTAFRGDQEFLYNSALPFDSWQKTFPGEIVSYKSNWKTNKLHDGKPLDRGKVRVLCFHGNPRPWSVSEL